VQIVGAGTTQITAANSGDENYNAACDSYLLTVRHLEFITTWQTDDDGQITIPVLFDGTETYGYDYSIDWGDGTTDTDVTEEITHTYSEAGIYTVTITGDFPAINFASNSTEASKILTIEQWGGVKWKSMEGAFHGCKNLEYYATDTPDLSEVTNMSMMFYEARSFNGDISGWDVSKVTDMSYMFSLAYSFNGDISGWDVSKVTDMSYMFCLAYSFNGDISGWDVGNVTNMYSMFYYAYSFNGDTGGWDVSNVINMNSMFYSAISFSNHDLSDWNVNQVTNHYNFSYNWGSGNTEPNWP
jgi:surface protein